jgi:hypothetical protein
MVGIGTMKKIIGKCKIRYNIYAEINRRNEEGKRKCKER